MGKRNLSFRSVKGPKGITDHFKAVEKWTKKVGFVIYPYYKDSIFTAKFLALCERGTIFQ